MNTLTPLVMAMFFANDEEGRKRIPIILGNLSVIISRNENDENMQHNTLQQNDGQRYNKGLISRGKRKIKGDNSNINKRGTMFKITVQYGSGTGKISWVVYRRFWDFVKLHYHYKKKYNNKRESHLREGFMGNYTRPPQFPSIPRHYFGKRLRKDQCQPQKWQQQHQAQQQTPQRLQQERMLSSKSRQLTDTSHHTAPTSIIDEDAVTSAVTRQQLVNDVTVMNISDIIDPDERKMMVDSPANASIMSSNFDTTDAIILQQADDTVFQALEEYLNQFIASLGPCAPVNRLCKFLEISHLGLQLAAQYPEANTVARGKEDYAVLQSRTDNGPKQKRRNLLEDGLTCSIPTTRGRRHQQPMWFIIRDTYVVCVEDPTQSEIYDVFLFDHKFDLHRLALSGDKSDHRKTKSKRIFFSNVLVNASHFAKAKSTLCLSNMHGIYHLRAKNEEQAKQLEKSIRFMASNSIWCKEHRFNSFAPIRTNSSVAWFVDGRDYFWDVSVALDNAKESIYIHDWWLSPELFLRRPAAQNLEWRLDRVLKRKADQGVKIYIVIYKEVAMALPLFSHQTKRHLLQLSPNIFVQRHPSRALDIFDKNSIFFWAHHEKICIVDNEIAFVGGIDQCFGRYDTPGHILVDDLKPELDIDNDHPQIWPGKDYSNPRIIDFHTLEKPFEDNQDRTTLPRMPWHDVSMRIVGPAARDVARHFIQRWNFLRRKKPTAPKKPTPMLLPIPESYTHQLSNDDPRICHPHTSRSCNVQILRSVSPWSIGSIDHTEKSIQNAYCESIRASEYFIYIENKIGEAIYDRIIRAHKQGEKWRAIIVLPLVPGFPANIDETEATTVRLIMKYQYITVGQGPDSLLGRLHTAGITHTHEYINFYGLRNWAELNGQYVTEQVYIHSKIMIVDDKAVIIGSANINERSQLGSRDSEIAAFVEDDDNELIDSFINNQPAKVGRFAHTLRMHLMCEHIGLDVDQMKRELYTSSMNNNTSTATYLNQSAWTDRKISDGDKNDTIDCLPPYVQVLGGNPGTQEKERIKMEEKDGHQLHSTNRKQFEMSHTQFSSDSSDTSSNDGGSLKNMNLKNIRRHKKHKRRRFLLSKSEKKSSNKEEDAKKLVQAATVANVIAKGKKQGLNADPSSLEKAQTTNPNDSQHSSNQETAAVLSTTNVDKRSTSIVSPTKSIFGKRKSTKEDFLDFWSSLTPDTDPNGDGKAGVDLASDYYGSSKLDTSFLENKTVGDIYRILQDPLSDDFQNVWHMLARVNTDLFRRAFLITPDNNVRTWEQYDNYSKMAKLFLGRTDIKHGGTKTTVAAGNATTLPLNTLNCNDNGINGIDDCSSDKQVTVHELIQHIKGHLVIWPNFFMEEEEKNNEFLFGVDKLAPLEIFD
ncbi:hypothetical protein BDF20DRAFT_905927 [Mycotypha africana]|uniref:uncharacterized protein n=1 Tax=Mycotypha africana TaxID=64632 RepID=UPI002300467F|nr:uncharacterized protein BDF20DRAFT_905927 [Mycotypha africana]KAI8979120.1 hypothetical protein BDF20DRAFT_905927 [Mycotypha africana]